MPCRTTHLDTVLGVLRTGTRPGALRCCCCCLKHRQLTAGRRVMLLTQPSLPCRLSHPCGPTSSSPLLPPSSESSGCRQERRTGGDASARRNHTHHIKVVACCITACSLECVFGPGSLLPAVSLWPHLEHALHAPQHACEQIWPPLVLAQVLTLCKQGAGQVVERLKGQAGRQPEHIRCTRNAL